VTEAISPFSVEISDTQLEDLPVGATTATRDRRRLGARTRGKAGDGEELLRKVVGHKPDVAPVDLRMPPTGIDQGVRAAERIGERYPDVGVLVLSDYLEPEFATRLAESGAPGRGYLLKVFDDVAESNSAARAVYGKAGFADPGSPTWLLGLILRDHGG